MISEILVNRLGLTYKTALGYSIATLPDVCKTPSPGGPVPIPYPNFANQLTLRKGTKTVKAKGKMIAIKGSEYSISFGDEPGVIGGVKSNTFKKETSWITYSFDVKMDGRNACRHTDKKFHNHKNTVNLAGNGEPTPPAGYVIDLDCEKKRASKDPSDRCDIEELCAKIKGYNESKHPKQRVTPSPSNRITTEMREDYKVKYNMTDDDIKAHNAKNNAYGNGLKAWKKSFTRAISDGPDSPKVKEAFYAECRHKLWKENGASPTPSGGRNVDNALQPDHVHDVALNGPTKWPGANIKWMDAKVNHEFGQQMKGYDPAVHGDTIKAADACKCDEAGSNTVA